MEKQKNNFYMVISSILLFIFLYGCAGIQITEERLATIGTPAIGVLPFQNVGDDKSLDWIGFGIQDAMTVDLSNISAFRTETLPAYLKRTGMSTAQLVYLSDERLPNVAPKFAVDFLIWGSYQKKGDKIRLTYNLFDVQQNKTIYRKDLQGTFSQLPSLTSEALLTITKTFAIKPRPGEIVRIQQPTTKSIEAFRLNAQGFQKYVEKPSQKDGAELLQQAVKADANYAEAWNNLGWATYALGDSDKALEAFEKALAIKPELIYALAGKGLILSQKKEFREAKATLEKALTLNPNLDAHIIYFGDACRGLAQLDTALAQYRRAIALNSKNEWYHEKAGSVLAKLQRYNEALDSYDKAIGINSGSDYLLNARGDVYYNLKQYDKAIKDYEKAIEINPQNPNYYSNTAKCLKAQNKLKEALDYYDKAIEKNPELVALLIERARIYVQLTTPTIAVLPFRNDSGSETLDWLSIGLQDAMTVDLYYLSAFRTDALPAYLSKTNMRPSELSNLSDEKLAQTARKINVDFLLFGSFKEKSGKLIFTCNLFDVRRQKTIYQKVYETNFAQILQLESEALLEIARALDVNIQPEEKKRVESIKTKSMEAFRLNAIGWEQYGEISYYQEKDKEKSQFSNRNSIQLFQQAVEADDNYAEAWNNLGWAFHVAEDYDKALEAFEKAVMLKPDLIDSLAGTGFTLLIQGREFAEARAALEKAVKLNPSLDAHHIYLGDALTGENKWEAALAQYQKAIALNSKNEWYYYRAGSVQNQLEKYNEAKESYDKAISINPNSDQLYNARGNAYYNLKQYNNAIGDYEKAIEINPENAFYYGNLANCLKEQNNFRDAINYYTKAIEKDSENIDFYRDRAHLYVKVSEDEKAIQDINAVLQRNESDAEAKLLLADLRLKDYLATEMEESYNEALEIYKWYLTQQTTEEGVSHALIKILNLVYIDHNWESVEKVIKQLQEINAHSSICDYILAQMYDLKEEKALSEQHLKKAMESDPELSVLFDNESFTFGDQNRLYLFAMINEARGLINLAFLQWQDLLYEYLPTDFDVFTNVFRHLSDISKFRDDLARYLVFERNGYIYRYDFLTKEAKQLTHGRFPLWSPDKTKIAFFRDEGPSLYIMDWNGEKLTQVRANLNDQHTYDAETYARILHKGQAYGWSQDGSQLLYGHSGIPGDMVIHFSTGQYYLFPKSAKMKDYSGSVEIDWSSRGEGYGRIWSIRHKDKLLLEYSHNDAVFSWKVSKDGEELIFLQNEKVYSIDIETGQRKLIFNPGKYDEDIELPFVTYQADGYGGVSEKKQKKSWTIQQIKDVSGFLSWGYTSDQVVLSWRQVEKADTKQKEDIDKSKGVATAWIEPVVEYGNSKILIWAPSTEGFMDVGEGTNPAWVPYSYYGILVEQAKKKMKTSQNSLLSSVLQKIIDTEKAKDRRRAQKETVYNKYVLVPIPNLDQIISRGFEQIRAGNIQSAISTFEQAVALNDTHPTPYIGLAIAYALLDEGNVIHVDNFIKAFDYSLKAIEIYPKPEYFFVQGWITLLVGANETNYSEYALTISLIDTICTALFAYVLDTDLENITENDNAARTQLIDFLGNISGTPIPVEEGEVIFFKRAFLTAIDGLDFYPALPENTRN